MKLTIIIPVFNEENTIGSVLEKVSKIDIKPFTKEVIVVNDGSTDASRTIVRDYTKKISFIKQVILVKNCGKGYAVRAGLKKATGDYCLIQDADLEYDPGEISRLIHKIRGNTSAVIYGVRNIEENHLSFFDRLLFAIHKSGTILLSAFASLLYGKQVYDLTTGYKLFPLFAITNIHFSSTGFGFDAELTARLLQTHLPFIFVPISYHPRNYSAGKKLFAITEGPKALLILLRIRLGV